MKKISRSFLYTEKVSILPFLGEGKSLEREFNSKLWERPFWGKLKNESEDTLQLFNNACYICTRIFYDDYPPNELKKYERIAIEGIDDPVWTNHIVPVTMALVVNWLSSKECQKISVERGRREDIEELCRRIHANIEENSVLPLEAKEDFKALTTQEHQLPSGFINDGCFLRKSFSEAMEDPSVTYDDIINSPDFLIDVSKNPNELLAAVGPDSHFLSQAQKVSINTEEVRRKMWESLKRIFKEDNCSQSTRSSVLKDNKSGVEINISDIDIAGDRIIDVIKILHSMCKIGLFKMKDGTKINDKTVMEYFGKMLNKDFSKYNNNLSDSKSKTKEESFLKVFDELRNEASKYYNKS